MAKLRCSDQVGLRSDIRFRAAYADAPPYLMSNAVDALRAAGRSRIGPVSPMLMLRSSDLRKGALAVD